MVKNPPANTGAKGRHRFDPWVGKIPWRGKWQPSLEFLPGEVHGQRSLVGYSPRGRKESDTIEQAHTDLSYQPWVAQILSLIMDLNLLHRGKKSLLPQRMLFRDTRIYDCHLPVMPFQKIETWLEPFYINANTIITYACPYIPKW